MHFCFFFSFHFSIPIFSTTSQTFTSLSFSPMFRIISRVRRSFPRRRRRRGADSDSGAVTQEERGAEERRKKNRDSSTSGRSAGEEASLCIRSEIVILGQSSSPSLPSPGPHCAGSVKRVFLLRSKEEKNPPSLFQRAVLPFLLASILEGAKISFDRSFVRSSLVRVCERGGEEKETFAT